MQTTKSVLLSNVAMQVQAIMALNISFKRRLTMIVELEQTK